MHGLWCPDSFTKHHVFEVYPWYSIYQSAVISFCWVVFGEFVKTQNYQWDPPLREFSVICISNMLSGGTPHLSSGPEKAKTHNCPY